MVGKQPKRTKRPGVEAHGRQSLHDAAASGNVGEVRRLLADGADPNAQDDNGWSALHFAAQAESIECVRLLLAARANPELRDASGNSVLWRAVFASNGKGEIIKVLRAAGADPLATNDHGVSPTSLARTINNYDVAQYFSDVEQ